MPLIGVPLTEYKEELHHIPKGVLPTRTIEQFEERLQPFAEELAWRAQEYKKFDPTEQCHALPGEFYANCTFEERAKIYATSFIQLPRAMDRLFEEDVRYRIIRKLRNSLWRWGYGDAKTEWNNVVDAYNGLRRFSFELPDFEVTLDHTTHYNEYGYGEHDHQTYLDGVFGLRVHYRGEHVMTIGFSIAKGHRLLISQIQLKKEKGNRFLFKLPAGRVVYVVRLMKRYFPGFRHYIVDGDSLVEKYLVDYRASLERARERKRKQGSEPATFVDKDIAYLEAHINGLEGEVGERIRRTYELTQGDYRISPHRPFAMNKMRFHRIVRA